MERQNVRQAETHLPDVFCVYAYGRTIVGDESERASPSSGNAIAATGKKYRK